MAGRFEVSTGKDKKFYFHLKAANGQIILASQGYAAKKSCLNGVESVRTNSQDAARFETMTAKNGKHYFVVKANNGQVVGTSQMYKGTSGCSNGMASVKKNAPKAKLVDLTAS